jgi:peroxiredoxin
MVRIGNVAMISTFEHNAVHVNTGIFISDMPGARIRMMVTKKLIPVINVPTPDSCRLQM